MSEIPEDVIKAAADFQDMVDGDPKAYTAFDVAVLAILAERSTCAKIAESFLEPVDGSDKDMMGVKRRHQPWFNDIAAAIRRR